MIAWLDPHDPFPPVDRTLRPESEAPSLLAASAELSPQRLLIAYRQDVFLWCAQGQPVLWWSTDPRMVFRLKDFRASTTFRRTLRRMFDDPAWEIRIDHGFRETMVTCAATARPGQHGTWITEDVIQAYTSLHRCGYAHSVEAWYAGERVGGLYDVALGCMFYGGSMFTHRTDISKIVLAVLCAFLGGQGVAMIDCQQETGHLAPLGGAPVPRTALPAHVQGAANAPAIVPWHLDKSVLRRWAVRNE